MARRKRPAPRDGLTLLYNELGTISIEEMAHAIIEDLHVLRDTYNVRYVRGSRLKLIVTDEHGDAVRVRRPGGGTVSSLYTNHFRPACTDYEL